MIKYDLRFRNCIELQHPLRPERAFPYLELLLCRKTCVPAPVEEVLLGDAADAVGAGGQTVGVGFGEDAFHPDINRQGVNFAEAVEQRAGRDLVADALDFFELLRRFFEAEKINFRKIDRAVTDLPRRIDYIFIPESRAQGRKALNPRFENSVGGGK